MIALECKLEKLFTVCKLFYVDATDARFRQNQC